MKKEPLFLPLTPIVNTQEQIRQETIKEQVQQPTAENQAQQETTKEQVQQPTAENQTQQETTKEQVQQSTAENQPQQETTKDLVQQPTAENQAQQENTKEQVQPKKEYHFRENFYFQALDEALDNQDVYNIAILGPYGAGKSSIIKSYLASNQEIQAHTINVTLGNYENNFDQLNAEDNSQTAYTKDANRIERQIILQLSSQIPPHRIRNSSFQFPRDRSLWEKLAIMSATLSLSTGLLALASTKIYNLFTIFDHTDLILILAIIIPIGYFMWSLLSSNIFQLNKISLNVGAASTELHKSTYLEETIIDRDIKEIVYMLVNSGIHNVVFEDLDRFNDIRIFNKLKEINLLVNNALKINKKHKISFIYVLNDSLFTKENRTKYFDFIIPVVQILTSKVSSHYIIKKFNEIQEKLKIDYLDEHLKREFLLKISEFIDDLRLANNILNEFTIYYQQAEIKKTQIDLEVLFVRVVFKNILPNEYEQFRKGHGEIYNVINVDYNLDYDSNYNYDINKLNLNKQAKDFINYLINNYQIHFCSYLHDTSKYILSNSYITQNDQDYIENSSFQPYPINHKIDNPEIVCYFLLFSKQFFRTSQDFLNITLIKYLLENTKNKYVHKFLNYFLNSLIQIHMSNEVTFTYLFNILNYIRNENSELHYRLFEYIYNNKNARLYIILKKLIQELVSPNNEFTELATDITLYLLKNSILDSETIDSCKENFTSTIESILLNTKEETDYIFDELEKLQIMLDSNKFSQDSHLYSKVLKHNEIINSKVDSKRIPESDTNHNNAQSNQ